MKNHQKKKRKNNNKKSKNKEISYKQKNKLRSAFRSTAVNNDTNKHNLQEAICFTQIDHKYFDLYPIDQNNG